MRESESIKDTEINKKTEEDEKWVKTNVCLRTFHQRVDGKSLWIQNNNKNVPTLCLFTPRFHISAIAHSYHNILFPLIQWINSVIFYFVLFLLGNWALHTTRTDSCMHIYFFHFITIFWFLSLLFFWVSASSGFRMTFQIHLVISSNAWSM